MITRLLELRDNSVITTVHYCNFTFEDYIAEFALLNFNKLVLLRQRDGVSKSPHSSNVYVSGTLPLYEYLTILLRLPGSFIYSNLNLNKKSKH